MKSPFPGMDPYLEAFWRDAHTTLITLTKFALNKALPGDLIARSEDRVYVESDERVPRRVHPDVRVSEIPRGSVKSVEGSAGVAVAEPVILAYDSEPVTEPYIVITEADTGRVVTGIELISPSNKRTGDEGRKAYLKKRRDFVQSEANLVEIDLTRKGNWRALMKEYRIPPRLHSTYRVVVRRSTKPDEVAVYPITLRERLPGINVPLRATDQDVPLDLQALVDSAYENSRWETIDYALPCEPPLTDNDEKWADRLLRKAGKR